MSAILVLIVFLATRHAEASQACERKLDLLLVADGSSTVCNGTETCSKWNSVLQFCKNLVNSFNIGPDDTKVAFFTVSDEFNKEWNLNGYTDKTRLLSAIENVKYPGGEFKKLGLLSTYPLVTEIYNPQFGEREGAPNVVISITDGIPDIDLITAGLASTAYQQARLVSIVVCVTPGCTENWAKAAASPPKKVNETYFLADGYSSLDQVTEILVQKVCLVKMPELLPALEISY